MANYTFSKKDGSAIDSAKAKKMMKKYEDEHKDGIRAYFYGSDLIQKIIDHPEAVGMRIYYAKDDAGKQQLVLIAAREDGSNIWPEADGKDAPGGGTVGDAGLPCPPYCP